LCGFRGVISLPVGGGRRRKEIFTMVRIRLPRACAGVGGLGDPTPAAS
jgi:hypothetical protein